MPLLEISAVMTQGCLRSRREGLHPWGTVSSPLAQEDGLGCCACPGGGEMGWEKSRGRPGWWNCHGERDIAGQHHTGTQDQGPAGPWEVFRLHGLDCRALSPNRHHQFLLHRPSWGQPLCKLSSEAERVCTKETGVAGTPLNGPCLGRRPTLGPVLLRGASRSWAV